MHLFSSAGPGDVDKVVQLGSLRSCVYMCMYVKSLTIVPHVLSCVDRKLNFLIHLN